MRDLRHLKILAKYTKHRIKLNAGNPLEEVFGNQLKKIEKEINQVQKKGKKNVKRKK